MPLMQFDKYKYFYIINPDAVGPSIKIKGAESHVLHNTEPILHHGGPSYQQHHLTKNLGNPLKII